MADIIVGALGSIIVIDRPEGMMNLEGAMAGCLDNASNHGCAYDQSITPASMVETLLTSLDKAGYAIVKKPEPKKKDDHGSGILRDLPGCFVE